LGDGDDDRNHEESGPVASSTSDATVRDAAALRPGNDTTVTGESASPSTQRER
jgi:hypothetical protein